jgi:hypothetical protein
MSTTIVVIILILAIALAHGTLLSNYVKSSLKLWVIVDYVWIGAASVGLIFATTEVRRMQNIDAMARQESEVRMLHHDALVGVRWTLILFEPAAENFRASKTYREQWQSGIDWFREAERVLELGWENDEWDRWRVLAKQRLLDEIEPNPNRPSIPDFAFRPQPPTPPQLLEYKKDAIESVALLHDAKERLQELRLRQRPTRFEAVSRYIWPWLLCFALAIRITKVTAELLTLLSC